ncbi:MAG: HD domain-containing protein, partial [Sulfurimonas sp.]|nr:HD domain-containing protein [Sulfurimonas sp.]
MKVVQTKINYVSSYDELNIESLNIGELLVFDILIRRNENYVIIIEAGTMLSKTLCNKLKKQDRLYISKKDKEKQLLTYKTLLTYVKYNKNNLKKSLELLYEINNKIFNDFINSNENIIDIIALEEIVKSIIFLVKNNSSYLKNTISDFNDSSELAYHAIHVTIYAINLGYFLNLNQLQLLQIGIASLLHDIGIKMINKDIIDKNAKLNIEELEAVHQHCKYSSDIATKNHIHDPYIIDAIMHHHESHDGTGYPSGLKSKDISNFASILSISDVFDALTNKRSYREKNSTFDALKIMMQDTSMANKFNQEYLKVFLQA